MPSRRKERPELPLLELVTMIFAQLAVDLKKSGGNTLQPCFSGDECAVHSTFFELKKDFGKEFEALEKLHFITSGSFPYSHELTDALYWSKHNGSYVVIGDKIFPRYVLGLEDLLASFSEKHSASQKDFRAQFRALVSRFEKIRVSA
jgi:hypothetical protein